MDYVTQFTPYRGLIGGVLIGLSAVLFLGLNGRIAGMSNLVHGLCPPKKPIPTWRITFLLGLFVGGLSFYVFPMIQFQLRTHYPFYILLIAGFLVGMGTRLGNGCTSGHGVCGIARLSRRSIVATVTFVLFGILATYLLRHIGRIY